MKTPRIILSSVAVAALVSTSACVTDPNTGEKTFSRTAAGAAIGGTLGYLLGGVIGGDAARIIGDDQIRELDEQTAGSGVDVEEIGDQDAILVRLPDGVTFATNSANINANFRATLKTVADSLIRYPDSLIDVYGFTDTTGSVGYNQDLSERRAQAVADYLVSQGVSRARIATRGYGEDPQYLRVRTGDNVAEPLNRRVEIKIVPISQEQVQAARR